MGKIPAKNGRTQKRKEANSFETARNLITLEHAQVRPDISF